MRTKYKVMQITPATMLTWIAQVSTRGSAAGQRLTCTRRSARIEGNASSAGGPERPYHQEYQRDLSDSLSFPANSLADLVRKLFWVLCNRLVITDASGAFTAYKTDGVTPAGAGTVTDNGTTTARSAPTWP